MSSPIVQGQQARVCEWPSVIVVEPSGCSGVLIHPRVFATAAHCLYGSDGRLEVPSSVTFGERRDEPAAQRAVDTCFLSRADGGDLAVCVLSELAPAVPIISAMTASESRWLQPGATAIEVGFGDRSVGKARDGGVKSWLEVYLVRARSDETYLEVSAGTQAGEYYGDSGGPLFFQMPDATWRVVGTDSGSADIEVDSTRPRFSVYSNVPYFSAWAEKVTGFVLTPCPADNACSPSSDCGSLVAASDRAPDSWTTDCSAHPNETPHPTCLDASRPDDDSPPGGALSDLQPAGGCQVATGGRDAPASAALSGLLLGAILARRFRLRYIFCKQFRTVKSLRMHIAGDATTFPATPC
ncbi:MAG TPA: trypsin-like serine protease [Polyangiaceae bacterium]|nr:trypsin-like serine protease [Polyangiaceae bacterium]